MQQIMDDNVLDSSKVLDYGCMSLTPYNPIFFVSNAEINDGVNAVHMRGNLDHHHVRQEHDRFFSFSSRSDQD